MVKSGEMKKKLLLGVYFFANSLSVRLNINKSEGSCTR